MNDQEFNNLIETARKDPAFGGDFTEDDHQRMMARFYNELGEEAPQKDGYSFSDYFQYFSWNVSKNFARPAAVALSVFLLVLGSWVTTVSASFYSVPGDTLYRVKLAAETVQVTFAGDEKKARLHAEFAGRRLQELAEINRSDSGEKKELAKVAVEGFTKQITLAQNKMTEIEAENVNDAVSVASMLNDKAEEYEVTLSQSDDQDEEEGNEVMTGAIDAVDEVNEKSIRTLVSSYEDTASRAVADDLEKRFQNKLNAVSEQITMNRGRIEVIELVIDKNDFAEDYSGRLIEARGNIVLHEDKLSTANDTLAASGFAKAFQLIDEVEGEVQVGEDMIIELELDITTAVQSQKLETEVTEEETKEESLSLHF